MYWRTEKTNQENAYIIFVWKWFRPNVVHVLFNWICQKIDLSRGRKKIGCKHFCFNSQYVRQNEIDHKLQLKNDSQKCRDQKVTKEIEKKKHTHYTAYTTSWKDEPISFAKWSRTKIQIFFSYWLLFFSFDCFSSVRRFYLLWFFVFYFVSIKAININGPIW